MIDVYCYFGYNSRLPIDTGLTRGAAPASLLSGEQQLAVYRVTTDRERRLNQSQRSTFLNLFNPKSFFFPFMQIQKMISSMTQNYNTIQTMSFMIRCSPTQRLISSISLLLPYIKCFMNPKGNVSEVYFQSKNNLSGLTHPLLIRLNEEWGDRVSSSEWMDCQKKSLQAFLVPSGHWPRRYLDFSSRTTSP